MVLVIPFQWLLRTRAQPVDANTSAGQRTWWQRFRHHLKQCIFDHPTVKAAAFLWTGKPWRLVSSCEVPQTGSFIGTQADTCVFL